jgi:hypothetical protein
MQKPIVIICISEIVYVSTTRNIKNINKLTMEDSSLEKALELGIFGAVITPGVLYTAPSISFLNGQQIQVLLGTLAFYGYLKLKKSREAERMNKKLETPFRLQRMKMQHH